MAELCDWVLADDVSRGFVFGVKKEDLMIDLESIYRSLDVESDSMEVSEETMTRVDEESGEVKNSLLRNGSQATGSCTYLNSDGPAASQAGVEMLTSFDERENGESGPSAVCYSDCGSNVVSYHVKCEPGSVSNLEDNMIIDSKFTPCNPTMVTPYVNGNGATQNSSVEALLPSNSSSNVDGADICAPYEPCGYNTMDAPLSEVSPNFVHGHTVQFFPIKEEFVNGLESGLSECQAYGASQMVLDRHDANSEFSIKCEMLPSVSTASVHLYNGSDGYQVDKELEQPYNCLSSFQEDRADVTIKPEHELDTVVYSSVPGKYNMCTDVQVVGETKPEWSGVSNSAVSYQTDVEKEYSFMAPQTDSDSRSLYKCFDSYDCLQYVPNPDQLTSSTEYLDYLVEDGDHEYIQHRKAGFNLPCLSSGTVESFSSERIPDRDGDSDICKIESHGEFVNAHQTLAAQRPVLSSNHSTVSQTLNNYGGLKLESNQENRILQAALQDLSQPKSEASPPDGVLAVPLLKHQRIALAWMSEKETSGFPCFGGILADDQGLGKTVSTIALIMTERSTPSLPCQEDLKDGGNDQFDNSQVVFNENKDREDNLWKVKGMPAAGTLIVCPTSLMRQWADEFRKKVTLEANLSVLVYHGCSRTKDPHELAKYDVVITTYSIVTLEVPKQPLVDKDSGIHDNGVDSACFFSNNKDLPNSLKKGTKKRKRGDCESTVTLSGPLAKVSWFRVVLDEAQSIKNHKTKAARASWGLHAKYRWCLSGTPIQNSIDDLYSYFRFLKYDPYSSYQLFCDAIKKLISRNPVKGYQKLQAILKTVMLRRTKDTLLDGKPVISLPPKSIELRKVDFTKEERDFYSKLERDSRDQFKEYAEAGTVKQNYVNILLMLLRLRQACGHPFLVSRSSWTFSVEVAKKLPYEKQIFLRNCLEDSLASCGICNDAPDDAVVSACGHVFCKQCICKCLAGDNNQCPLSNCKVGLEISSLFSKATLENVMLGLHELDAPHDRTSSDPIGTGEPCLEDISFGSSKIKAALDILQSLSKQRPATVANDLNENSQHEVNQQPHKSSSFTAAPVNSCVDGMGKIVGEKAIVFSQWTKMLDLLEARLKSSGIQYRRFDGKMSVAARDKAIHDFNTLPEVCVMMMSLKAASLGLNLVVACHVLLLDLWWNPTTEDQAIDRAHRIGQTRPVNVVRLTVKDTVEDRILALQDKKRLMVACAFGEDVKGGRQSHLTVEDLKYLFKADT